MFVGFVLFKEPEFYWRALEAEFFTQRAVHVAFVAPVQELGAGAVNFEVSGVVFFLHHVVEFWGAVF